MDMTLRPGDFPLGSLESRMAARAEIERAEKSRPFLRIVSYIPRPWRGDGPEPSDWNKVPRISEPQSWGDGLMQILYVPSGMTAEEARKILGI
jgi:hypothetical protein